MKYSSDDTIEFAKNINYPNCIKNLNALIKDEGYKGTAKFKTSYMALDMDCVEEKYSIAKSKNRNQSIDALLTLKQKSKTELLLVEFKFNKEEFDSLKKSEIEGKVKGTKDLLNTLNNEITIHNKYFIVFGNRFKQQAINRLSKIMPSLAMKIYIATDLDGLLSETYFK